MNDSRPKKILLIDDDITALDIVSFLFEERGFTVERCVDGYSALDTVARFVPDVLVVDLMMPGINGVETVQEMRGRGLAGVPIIAFTAVDDPELHDQARKAGCNLVLTKPCRPEKILRHVQELTETAQAKS